jgi:hypothetical protein
MKKHKEEKSLRKGITGEPLLEPLNKVETCCIMAAGNCALISHYFSDFGRILSKSWRSGIFSAGSYNNENTSCN